MQLENQHVVLTKAQTGEVVFDGRLSLIPSGAVSWGDQAEFRAFIAGDGYKAYVDAVGPHNARLPGMGIVSDDMIWCGVVCQICQRDNAVSVRDRRRKEKHERLCLECFRENNSSFEV